MVGLYQPVNYPPFSDHTAIYDPELLPKLTDRQKRRMTVAEVAKTTPDMIGVLYDRGNRNITHVLRPMAYVNNREDAEVEHILTLGKSGSLIKVSAEPVPLASARNFLLENCKEMSFNDLRVALQQIALNPGAEVPVTMPALSSSFQRS